MKLLFAEGVPFKVSSSSLNTAPTTAGQSIENGDPESTLIDELKYLAVSNWLQDYLSQRYNQFDKYVTPEFAEKYILDYKVSRTGTPSGGLDLIGHLDGEALKKWVRLVDSKSKASNQIKPLFIISSQLPGLSISPGETAHKLRDSSTAQLLSQMTQQQLNKLNAHLSPLESSLSIESPPKNSSEIQSLTSLARERGQSLVLWESFSTCPGCTNPRFDIFLYNTQTQNISFVVGDDLALSMKDLTNTELLKRSLLPIFQQFQSELEKTFSEGSLQETPFKLILENVDSYRALKTAEAELSRGNGFSSPIFKRVGKKTAEYEVKSSLSIEELAVRVQSTVLPGFKTEVSKVDSSTLVVRYSK